LEVCCASRIARSEVEMAHGRLDSAWLRLDSQLWRLRRGLVRADR
jgi:hypothetical protein